MVQSVLTGAGGSIAVCGRSLTNMDIDNGHSLVEALCLPVDADPRLLLFQELTAVALNAAAGGATFPDLAMCTAVCTSGVATPEQVDDCVNLTRAFNCSGGQIASPFEPSGPGDPVLIACGAATGNLCNALFSAACAVP